MDFGHGIEGELETSLDAGEEEGEDGGGYEDGDGFGHCREKGMWRIDMYDF